MFSLKIAAAPRKLRTIFSATMLGTTTKALPSRRVISSERLVEYSRGAVKILNRKKLESFACECYGVVQQFNGELGLK